MIDLVRVTLFEDRTDALLLVVPELERGDLVLPALRYPFDQAQLAKTLGDAGIKNVVKLERSGRWTQALNRARSDQRAARGARENELRAARAADLARSKLPADQERARLMVEKLEVDERVRDLREQLGRARSGARDGKYMDPKRYRDLEERLDQAKTRSQAIQLRLSELKREAREESTRSQDNLNALFVREAMRVLGEQKFHEIMDAALEAQEEKAAQC